MLWGFVCEQWPLLLLGLPFMFAGSLIDLVAPNYVGKIIDQFKAYNFESEGGVYDLLIEWIMWTLLSGFCTFIREAIFGITS